MEEGWGEEARSYWFPLSSVLSPLVPRRERRQSLMQPCDARFLSLSWLTLNLPPAQTVAGVPIHYCHMNLVTIFRNIVIALFGVMLFLQTQSAHAATIADSIPEFSGVQGGNGWFYGYRDYTGDGGGVAYDPAAGFIPFAGGAGQGAWDGASQFWTGTIWDLNTAGAAPWTEVGPQNVHPNGSATTDEHWAIRRWVADELAGPAALAIAWHTRKQASAGGGVTGGLYLNGKLINQVVLAGTNTAGLTRTNYLTVQKGDRIDLVLTPVGRDGAHVDGSDGSVQWMRVDTTTDTDSDGLPDEWETQHAGDLTTISGTGDFDADGLSDRLELASYTNPAKSDTDGDGVTDGAEVSGATDPLDPNAYSSTTIVANSADDFSGVQGQEGWYSGYRIAPAPGVIADYPTNQVTLFPGGDAFGAWANQAPWTDTGPAIQTWTGGGWDLNTAAAAPWTELGAQNTHPNGNNNGQIHWTVRRWQATGITSVTPFTLRYFVRKSNPGGSGVNGVTAGLFVNGKLADTITIGFANNVGTTRAVYANLAPGDLVDLILSPMGFDGGNADGSDGTVNRLEIDSTIPPNAKQPDGTSFISANASDADGDGLPDPWELSYGPNLTRFSRAGDFDTDGLSDRDEFLRDSDPTKGDTDGDGLPDLAETNTGLYVSTTNTGSNPRKTDSDSDTLTDGAEVNALLRTDPNKADSDSDGFTDPEELAVGTNPTVPQLIIANSQTEFSGIQGSNGWWNGFRNYTLDGETTDYNPTNAFIPYPGGAGQGPWSNDFPWTESGPSIQTWTGTTWDLNTAGAAPWTAQGPIAIHPNSGGGEEHWAIRRWVATELTNTIGAVINWTVRKENLTGDGVTGSLHINGKQVDSITIGGANGTNPARRVFVNLKPGDIVDLALTPQGLTTRADGADGSFTSFSIDTVLPREPRQPNGDLFVPANAPDTDGDGLPDFWEMIFANDLTTFSGTGDNDTDNLNNAGEFGRDTSPLQADTDGDGLGDVVETKTGTFVSAVNAGTHPRRIDSDNDGYSDSIEVGAGTNPNDAVSNPAIADSRTDFSGTQGQNGWSYGYRNFTADGGATNYNAVTGFVPFTDDLFNGTIWDLEPAASGPWDELGREASHPNGSNSPPNDEHWTIRRWQASELTQPRMLRLRWHVRKVNLNGTGVTGALYINGVLVESASVAGNDGTGVIRTNFATIKPTDLIDLIHSPVGPTGDRADGADGSALWLTIDAVVPAVPAAGPKLQTLTLNAGQATIRWESESGATYAVEASADLRVWTKIKTGQASGGTTTSYAETLPSPMPAFRFYRIQRE
jgi:hypothetical protein